MRIYLCEDSPEGIFTGICDALSSGQESCDLRLLMKDDYEPELFVEYVDVSPDSARTAAFISKVRREISYEAFSDMYRAALSTEEDRADTIFRFALRGFEYGGNVTHFIQDPAVSRIFEISRRVGNESDKFIEFIRFEELSDGILFSKIAPKSRVMTLIAPHFKSRLSGENWLIYDETHLESAVHPALKDWSLVSTGEEDIEAFLARRESEDGYVDLWKVFFDSVAIEERKNARCQQNLLPEWYRKNMAEFSSAGDNFIA